VSAYQPPYQSPREVAPGIYLVPIPIPIPLKYVNCYLFKGPSGWTLMDTGFHDELAEAAWPRALDELGIRFQDIDRIVVTHYHPDHLGAAGWLQEKTGAPAYLHEVELRQVQLFWGMGMEEQARALGEFFHEGGMPAEITAAIVQHHHNQWQTVLPMAEFTPIPTGSLFQIGDRHYEVIWAPGHSDGLAVFWDAETGILIANDMLLAQITPNVSLWPACRPNPLADYLTSLAEMEELGARLALTGHRDLITDVAGRAQEIRRHHMERLEKMASACAKPEGATAWDVCREIFEPERLTTHQIRFAMSETLAHLVYLEEQGRLIRRGSRYHALSSI
jgi:glyoxylase-like metal-dependent hydrolase (beta-lactamase superfamily II)